MPIIHAVLAMVLCACCQVLAAADQPAVEPMPLPERMRGTAIIATGLRPEVVRRMAADRINVIRLQLDARDGIPWTPEDPLAPYRPELARLHESLPLCAELGIRVVLAAGNIPGRKLDVLWKEADDNARFADHLPRFWTAFAREFRGYPALVAYDVFNEPNYPAGASDRWYQDLLPRSVAAIRAENPLVWLVVEPGPWAFPEGFATLPVLDDPRVIYSLHWYAPHGYTHQGIREARLADMPRDRVYPGELRAFYDNPDRHRPAAWDRRAMLAHLAPVVDFQRRTGARIWVGEFGVARWAPGGDRWLADSIACFEELGWGWAVIGYPVPDRAETPDGSVVWTGWSLSYADVDPRIAGPYLGGSGSGRFEVLRAGWRLNAPEAVR